MYRWCLELAQSQPSRGSLCLEQRCWKRSPSMSMPSSTTASWRGDRHGPSWKQRGKSPKREGWGENSDLPRGCSVRKAQNPTWAGKWGLESWCCSVLQWWWCCCSWAASELIFKLLEDNSASFGWFGECLELWVSGHWQSAVGQGFQNFLGKGSDWEFVG